MRVLFDTSVLIAALTRHHHEHASAILWLNRVLAGEIDGCLSNHGVAELYSVMTGHPAWRIAPEAMLKVLREDLASFRLVPLLSEDYWHVVERLTQLDLPGGGIFDALHAQAALKAEVDVLLTLNAKHFTRLGVDVATLVRTP